MQKPTRTRRNHADAANRRTPHPANRTYRGRQQYNNVSYYIATGSRPDLLPLAKYHYLPHLPATTKHVIRAVDKNTGLLIGVCSLGYPTLRSSLREAIFGHNSPAALNKNFTQLQRLTVHPKHGHKGIAHALLRRAVRTATTPIIEATNRSSVPPALFTECGFVLHRGEGQNYYYHTRKTS